VAPAAAAPPQLASGSAPFFSTGGAPSSLTSSELSSHRFNLRTEWRRHVDDIEALLARSDANASQLETAVNLTLMLSRQLVQMAKTSHVREMDFAVFATYACFGVESAQQQQQQQQQPTAHLYQSYFQELTRDLEIGTEPLLKVDKTLRDYAEELERLRGEQALVTAELSAHLRSTATQLYAGVDSAGVHAYATKFAHLQHNYEAHWAAWDRAVTAVNECLTPLLRAQLLVRKKAFLDNAALLNEMWQAVNRQPPLRPEAYRDWEPVLAAVVPLPFHLCHSYLH
jgi:hypothetical protein